MQIVWFRRDLRLNDSEIVSRACRNGLLVLPCFVVDPWFYEQSDVAAARVKFLFESLENLDANLRSLGSRLYLFEGESVDVIGRLTRSLLELNQKPKLYFNRDVQVQYGIDRDHSIINFYCSYNLESYIGTNHFLQPDNQHLDDWWQDYHDYQSQSTYPTPQEINTPELVFDIPQLTFAQLWQKYGQNQKSVANKFRGGEDQAQATLDSFLAHRYRGYH